MLREGKIRMNNVKETKERSVVLQILRGMAIILVLFHHSSARVSGDIFLRSVESVIICIHMPVFFIISGYLYQKNLTKYEKQGKKRFILGKIKHLLLPYAFWYILLWLLVNCAMFCGEGIKKILIENEFPPMNIFEMLYGLFTYQKFYTEHLWFLYVLFFYFIVHMILGNIGSSKIMIFIGIVMSLATNFIQFPNIIGRFMLWFVFFAFGRCISRYESIELLIKSKKRYMAFVIFSILCGFKIWLGMAGIFDKNLLLFTDGLVKCLLGFFGVWCLYILSQLIDKGRGKVKTMFKYVGDYSYDIYLIHNPYIVAFMSFILSHYLKINSYLTILIAVTAGILLPVLLSKIILRRFSGLSLLTLGRSK